MKNIFFPNWDEQDEHQFQLDMMQKETEYLRELFLEDTQRRIDLLCQNYPFVFMNKTLHTMGITGSFFQGDAKEDIAGLDGGTFILNLKVLKMEPLIEVSTNEWKTKGEYFQKIFFFPVDNIQKVKDYLDSL